MAERSGIMTDKTIKTTFENPINEVTANRGMEQSGGKQQVLKRLLIFLAFSFGLTWLFFLLFIPKGSTWGEMESFMQSFVSLGMLGPITAHFLTRLITKEGFRLSGEDSMMLGMNFRDKKWIIFLLALLLPWVVIELGSAVVLLLCPEMFDLSYPDTLGVEANLFFLLPLSAMVTGVIGSFAALGEEGGWRAYMMPKLFKLFGEKKLPALIIGGIIWGLWHAPLTCIGHNYGTEYPGFPFVGILMMCVFCTLLGIILSFLTEKSGSVWPAAFMHAVFNAHPSVLIGFMNEEKVSSVKALYTSWGGMIIALVVVSAIVMLVWHRNRQPAC